MDSHYVFRLKELSNKSAAIVPQSVEFSCFLDAVQDLYDILVSITEYWGFVISEPEIEITTVECKVREIIASTINFLVIHRLKLRVCAYVRQGKYHAIVESGQGMEMNCFQ